MLKTGCILEDYNEPDIRRISVMSRHTLNDGTTPDRRIVRGVSYDEWRRVLAPPAKLVGDYYKRGLKDNWKEFENRYKEYLNSIYTEVESLALAALGSDLRILCIEKTPEKCHRRVLAEMCVEIVPELEVSID